MKICVWDDLSVSIRESSASSGQMTTRASSTRLGFVLSPCHRELRNTRWWFQLFFIFTCTSTWGRFPFRLEYFSDGSKPPTRIVAWLIFPLTWDVRMQWKRPCWKMRRAKWMQSDNKATTEKVTRNREVIPVFKVVESDEMSSNQTFSEHFDKVKVHIHQLVIGIPSYPQVVWGIFQFIPQVSSSCSFRYPQVEPHLHERQELPMDTFRAADLPDPEELVSARRAVLQEAKVRA